MSMESLMVESCIVLRPEYTRSASGAVEAKYQPIGTYSCRKWVASANKRVVTGGQAEVVTHMVVVPANADVKAKDRLRFGKDDFDILGVDPVRGADEIHHIEVQAQQVIR